MINKKKALMEHRLFNKQRDSYNVGQTKCLNYIIISTKFIPPDQDYFKFPSYDIQDSFHHRSIDNIIIEKLIYNKTSNDDSFQETKSEYN